MIRLISFAALTGFSIALLIGSAAWYAEAHQVRTTSVFVALLHWLSWLWPTAIMNGPDGLGVACSPAVCASLLAVSAIANAVVYAGLAFCLRFVWTKLVFRRSGL
jgi:hypothetical protein